MDKNISHSSNDSVQLPESPRNDHDSPNHSPARERVSTNSSQRKQNTIKSMGPKHLLQTLEVIQNSVNVGSWKNVPVPVCEATLSSFKAIETLKRFNLYLDGRVTNLSSKVDQN